MIVITKEHVEMALSGAKVAVGEGKAKAKPKRKRTTKKSK